MTIHEIAEEFERLFPDDVDSRPCDHGNGYQAGYQGFEHDGQHIVGCFYDAGNQGNPVIGIHPEDVETAHGLLRATGCLKGRDKSRCMKAIADMFSDAGVRHELFV